MTWPSKLRARESKEPRVSRGSFSFYLVRHRDIGRLRALRAFFDSKLDLLSFLQVAITTITLNGRVMDENIRSAFAGDKTVTFFTIEPLNRTTDTFRHCICLLWQFEILGV